MSSPVPPARIFRFGVFEFDVRRGELRKYGLKIRIARQPLKLLQTLLQSPGQLLSREELGRQLLPGVTFGDFEGNLNKAICQLRQALGDSASSPRYIETLANQGYRFIPLPEAGSQSPSHERRARKLGFVAVLPLASDASQPELDFLGRQLVCRLIDKLSNAGRLRVLAYGTVKPFVADKGDPQSIGLKLGVQGVVTGEILRHDDRLILELELIDVADGAHVWGLQVVQSWSDAAVNGERLAEQIGCELQPVLMHGRKSVQEDSLKTDALPTTLRDTSPQITSTTNRKRMRKPISVISEGTTRIA
jgi:DNA-binding winged helix-turn-helix (wHTH) protein